jgi:hypothetical protein
MSPVKYELGFYIPEDSILHVVTNLLESMWKFNWKSN